MKFLLQLLGVALCAVGLISCLRDDEYTTDASARLFFAEEKVDLDTIIAGQATNTYSFMVYNKNAQAIRISQVYLEKGANSPFYVNVDGSSVHSTSIAGIEIGAEDSLRVFLFANATDTNKDAPEEISDRLVFVTEAGIQQFVTLEADAQSVYKLKGEVITSDKTLLTTRPYQIYDSLVVAEGATLTLNAGTRLYFHPTARLIVRGRLVAVGSADSPVLFRGDRLGNMFAGQPYDRIPAQWGGIVFAGNSYGNHLNFCDIHSGEFGLRVDSGSITQEKLRLENSIVHNVSGDALSLTMSKVFVGNSQITNAGGHCVAILGGDNEFVQTTIANFYPFSANRGVALKYSNVHGATTYPLLSATFRNTLITGYSTDEIQAEFSEDKSVTFNYLYQNCLLNTKEVEDGSHIVNSLWENDKAVVTREKNFAPSFDLEKLLFNFTLSESSQAVDEGDVTIGLQYPTDRQGRARDNKPDIGCYELIK